MLDLLKCSGCQDSFKDNRTLSRHIDKCDKFLGHVQTVQRKRKTKAKHEREAKHRRKEAEALEAEEWGGIEWKEGEWAEVVGKTTAVRLTRIAFAFNANLSAACGGFLRPSHSGSGDH